jgi:hypothetical protein
MKEALSGLGLHSARARYSHLVTLTKFSYFPLASLVNFHLHARAYLQRVQLPLSQLQLLSKFSTAAAASSDMLQFAPVDEVPLLMHRFLSASRSSLIHRPFEDSADAGLCWQQCTIVLSAP